MHDDETIKFAPESSGIDRLILRRWSPRAFSDKPVDGEDLKKLFLAASWAPSCFNEQPWRFIVGRQGDGIYERIGEILLGVNRQWATTAPVLLLSTAKRTLTRDGRPNPCHFHDVGLASAMLTVQATALGLYAHGMAGFDRQLARTAFNVPDDFDLCATWAVGHLGNPDTLPEPLRTHEKGPRSRKPLHEFVFSGWDKPAF